MGSTYKTSLANIFSLQKRALKLCKWKRKCTSEISDNPGTDKVNHHSIFKVCARLSIYNLNKFLILKFIYQVLNHLSPLCFYSFFTLKTSIHSHNTRTDEYLTLFLKSAESNVKKLSLSVRGPVLWNSIPCHIRSSESLRLFSKHLKEFLIANS